MWINISVITFEEYFYYILSYCITIYTVNSYEVVNSWLCDITWLSFLFHSFHICLMWVRRGQLRTCALLSTTSNLQAGHLPCRCSYQIRKSFPWQLGLLTIPSWRIPISHGRTSQNTKWSSAKYLVRKLPGEGTCVSWVQNGGIHGHGQPCPTKNKMAVP